MGNGPALLALAGKALYGDQWQRPLALALERDNRLVRRWAAGDRDIPQEVWEPLRALLRDRAAALAAEVRAVAAALDALPREDEIPASAGERQDG